ncbi:MAG TPA: AAA family ATPase [Chloroflexota bacterium]|nr:AAA family ATPase [Chloroflexota bacterium]
MPVADVSQLAARLLEDLGAAPAGWRRPVVVGLFGLPCTGKTQVARYLGARIPCVTLTTDVVRLQYGLPSGPATHEVMYVAATALLARQAGIVWDGLHLGRADREHLRRFAAAHGAATELIYTTAVPEVIAGRLQARLAAPERTAAEGKFPISPEQFARIASFLDPPGPEEGVTTVDTTTGTDRATGAQLARLLARLRERLD